MLNYYPMGQYFKIVNLDKKEYLAPHSFKWAGGKLNEGWGEINWALNNLLAQGFHPDDGWERDEFLGRWAGDRITIIGDYDESGLYQRLEKDGYKNLSLEIQEYFRQKYEIARQKRVKLLETLQDDDLPDPFLDE